MIICGPKTYGGAIGWDGAGPLALEQTGDVVFEQPIGPRIDRGCGPRINRVGGPSRTERSWIAEAQHHPHVLERQRRGMIPALASGQGLVGK